MNNIKTLAVFNLIGFVLVIVLNTLANALPINGLNTGELSDFYPNLFVPAGFTFAIWGVIYLLLLAFIIYQIRKAFSKNNDSTYFERIGWYFFLSCLGNASWIVAWHYQYVALSLILMLVILGSLLMIYQRLCIGTKPTNIAEKIFVHIPFSVYLGWITVATIANTTAFAVDNNWSGFGISEATWTMIMITIATFIGMILLFKRRDWAFALVLVWAFYGIYAKRSAIDSTLYSSIITISLMGIGILSTLIIWTIFKSRKSE